MPFLKATEGPRPKPESLRFHFLMKPLEEARVLLFLLCKGLRSASCRHPWEEERPVVGGAPCLSQQGKMRRDQTALQNTETKLVETAAPRRGCPMPKFQSKVRLLVSR